MKISIAKQGAPVVNSAMTVISSDDVEVIELDMTTKYCEVVASSGQTVYIACRETALHWYGDDKTALTEVVLAREGFEFFACGGGRYTIRLVFVREGALYTEHDAIWFEPPEELT